MDHAHWLKDAIVFLVAAGVIVPLFARFRISAVLGFLIAGLIIGPFGAGRFVEAAPWLSYFTISDPEAVEPLAEIGVIFLLFLLGLELSFEKLWAMRRMVLGAGGFQTALSALIVALALSLFLPTVAAISIALALCLSSTAVVMQILAEQRRAGSETGQASLSILLFQDLLVAPILIAVAAMARPETNIAWSLGQALIAAAIVIGVIVIAGRFVLRPLLRVPAQAGRREFMLALTFAIALLAALATEAAGLSLALGAFLAGILVGETEYRFHVEIDLEPFKGLLIGLFFVSVGMGVNLAWAAPQLHWIGAGIVALILVKFATAFTGARLSGARSGAAVESALLLAPAGEFGFVIIGAAAGAALLPPDAAAFVTVVIGGSMILTPVLQRLAPLILKLRPASETGAANAPRNAEDAPGAAVVIGGFGRVGQYIAAVLEAEGVDYIAIDQDADLVRVQRKLGRPVYFGDASRRELLEIIGAGPAQLYLISVSNEEKAERMAQAARDVSREAAVVARARNVAHANRLLRAGVDQVVPEAMEAGLQIAAQALERLGVEPDAVQHRLEAMREQNEARLHLRSGDS
ncbi:MAG: cation:proton antiporter [Euryhalocaulis sp.]|uniref:cation:proton antiporter domain-containing protein n=1 Tax=Euryhalocaulis sp. TaxID=2744307 RepID=UPI0017F2B20F|nr:cation:proton antiporter [Euryhalocaulis sp.]MBA4802940.1 cation:proton antiporter [Euryhalocaulis sp.]